MRCGAKDAYSNCEAVELSCCPAATRATFLTSPDATQPNRWYVLQFCQSIVLRPESEDQCTTTHLVMSQDQSTTCMIQQALKANAVLHCVLRSTTVSLILVQC